MKKPTLCILMAAFLLSSSALAARHYKIGEPFEVTGSISHFYGRDKSAEAKMWEKALGICKNLGQGRNSGLIANRLSDVVFSIGESDNSSNVQATFACLPAGMAN